MHVTCYHNPRCSKSRQTVHLLQEHGANVEIIEYLKTPPSFEELSAIIQKLGMVPRDLMRKKESAYKDNNLDDLTLDSETLIKTMIKHPLLIERPIVMANGKAVIGRPPELALTIL